MTENATRAAIRPARGRSWACLVALAAGLASAAGAAAQEAGQPADGATGGTAGAGEGAAAGAEGERDIANGTAFGDWIVSCTAASVRRTSCRLIQEQVRGEDEQLLGRFIAVPASDGAIMLAQVPMGVYLPGGAVWRFAGDEDGAQQEMIWQRCAGELCEAAAPLDEEMLERFAEHDAILFGYAFQPGQDPIVLRVDISRFAEAMELLREVQG